MAFEALSFRAERTKWVIFAAAVCFLINWISAIMIVIIMCGTILIRRNRAIDVGTGLDVVHTDH